MMIPQDAISKYVKIEAMHKRGASPAERRTAQGILEKMRKKYPGIEYAVLLDQQKRQAPPPPPPQEDSKKASNGNFGQAPHPGTQQENTRSRFWNMAGAAMGFAQDVLEEWVHEQHEQHMGYDEPEDHFMPTFTYSWLPGGSLEMRVVIPHGEALSEEMAEYVGSLLTERLQEML